MAKNPSISIQPTREQYSKAQHAAATLSGAEGPVKMTGLALNALVFYVEAMSRCPACQAGSVCVVHGTRALRPSVPSDDDVPAADCHRVTQVYFSCFTEARGQRPVFAGHEGSAIKRLIRSTGIDRAELAIRGAFKDPFWKDKATIITIANDPSRHLGNSTAPNKGSLQADSGFVGGKEVR